MTVFVYIIVADGANSPVKIGIAENPKKRLRQLQTGNPQRLRLAHVFEAESREVAVAWEMFSHKLFGNDRLAGEWFDVEADIAADHIRHWKHDPVKKGVNPKAALSRVNTPAPIVIPDDLRALRKTDMTQKQRLAYWACFDLPQPPYGFDDWYVVGSPKHGALAAFPVVGFTDEVAG